MTTTTGTRTSATASASEKTLLVLEAALTHSRFTEVVQATGLAKATTHRILSTLADRQFIAVASDGSYLPGPKILSLAGGRSPASTSRRSPAPSSTTWSPRRSAPCTSVRSTATRSST